ESGELLGLHGGGARHALELGLRAAHLAERFVVRREGGRNLAHELPVDRLGRRQELVQLVEDGNVLPPPRWRRRYRGRAAEAGFVAQGEVSVVSISSCPPSPSPAVRDISAARSASCSRSTTRCPASSVSTCATRPSRRGTSSSTGRTSDRRI